MNQEFPDTGATCIALIIAVLGFSIALGGCHGNGRADAPMLVERESHELFLHHAIDRNPPGGGECCTDVLALGDINGDGYLDVIIGSEGDDGAGLVWYEYPSWTRHDIDHGNFTTDGKVIDFDGDGDLDIVVGDSDRGLLWYEHEAGDRWRAHELGKGYVHDLVVVDVDGDGHLDVLTTDKKRLRRFDVRSSQNVIASDLLVAPGEGLAAADIDADGDVDIAYANVWLEQRRDGDNSRWISHDIDRSWPQDTRVQIADMNGDARLDVVMSGSEGDARLAWFERGAGNAGWTRHFIGTETLTGAHSLQVADFDLDGAPDVLVAEMSTSSRKRVVIYRRAASDKPEPVVLATHGSHNMVAADLDGDGDMDIVGKNYQGPRFVEYWENRSADLKLVPPESANSEWRYDPIDTSRPDSDRFTMGLLSADIDTDGRTDVVAGGTLYLHPSVEEAAWPRMEVAPGLDIVHVLQQRHANWPMFLAQDESALFLVSAEEPSATRWRRTRLHSLPPGRSQGRATGRKDGKGNYDFYFTRGTTLFRLLVSASKPPGSWPLVRVRNGVQEEAVALGDLDGDGDDDVVVVDGDGRRLVWLETDGDGPRTAHRVGASLRWIDRVAIADLDGDGHNDIVFTEESRDLDYNARVVWLKAQGDPRTGRWTQHAIVVLRSVNSLAVTDIDRNGSADLIVAEHTDMRAGSQVTDNFTGIFRNRGDGTFVTEVVEIGPHSSHLGALTIGPEAEGRFEIVSVGWEQSCCVHRWVKAPVGSAGTNSN